MICHSYYVLIYNSYTGVTLLYTGMMYHEEKKVNQWMTTFSVVRDLEVLQQVCNYNLGRMSFIGILVFRE